MMMLLFSLLVHVSFFFSTMSEYHSQSSLFSVHVEWIKKMMIEKRSHINRTTRYGPNIDSNVQQIHVTKFRCSTKKKMKFILCSRVFSRRNQWCCDGYLLIFLQFINLTSICFGSIKMKTQWLHSETNKLRYLHEHLQYNTMLDSNSWIFPFVKSQLHKFKIKTEFVLISIFCSFCMNAKIQIKCTFVCLWSNTVNELLVDRGSVKFESNHEYYINLNYFVSCMSPFRSHRQPCI